MHLMRELLGMQLVEIGNAFGGRDHSTVIHSIERVSEMVRDDPDFSRRVQKVETGLRGVSTG
jgi:chromosomal replication initiator protein